MANITEHSRKIEISEMSYDIPNFIDTYEKKESLVKNWLIRWITNSIANTNIKENDILPTKFEISELLGVSQGTVQNAIRSIEDQGYVKSKQRIGTLISNVSNPIKTINKSITKKDKSVYLIKKYIIDNSIPVGAVLPSVRKMSDILDISPNTIRSAYESLTLAGIISARREYGRDSNRILAKIPDCDNCFDINKNSKITTDTLVITLTKQIKEYIISNYEIGDKIPSHKELSEIFNVSVKTIHDAISALCKENILLSRRGQYGTILSSKTPLQGSNSDILEEMFANASVASTYSYQKIEKTLLDMIINHYKSGDKLPSMKDLSINFDVSTNTIRKALTSLEQQGYVTFGRGRFGGTFVVDVPEEIESQEAYQWLAISPDYIHTDN